MKYIFKFKKIMSSKSSGFVLPYTLFITSIMIVITTSVSSILIKQLYFSRLSRQSQAAYYAADNAIMCATAIDGAYVDDGGVGIFPYTENPVGASYAEDMQVLAVDYTNAHRAAQEPSLLPLASTLADIRCAQTQVSIFNTDANGSNFSVNMLENFEYYSPTTGTELGRTSTFKMKMDLGDGTFRCAKVTVNKTPSYRQIIAQGYALCDRPDGSVERAVVETTLTH